MKMDKKEYLKAIAVPLIAGGVAALLSGSGMKEFASLNQPPLTPPGWLFPVVWTILYVLMGTAYYMVNKAHGNSKLIAEANTVYALQLIANFIWPILFFGFGWYFVAFIWLVILWILILVTVFRFFAVSKKAAYLLVPYVLWVTFAGYLNLGIWWLNS